MRAIGGKGERRLDDVPPFWEWLAQQHNNTDAVRAEAARYIAERWQLGPWYNHRKVLSSLKAEESEHLHGARLLTQDFADLFDLAPEEQVRDHGLGVVSPLVPVGREQCTHEFKSGRRCRRDAVPGAGVCGQHGGSWMNESERAEMVQQINAKMVDLAERAVATMADLMDNAKSEKVRGDMAVALLDRIGVGPINKVELSVTPAAEEVTQTVKARLIALRGGVAPVDAEADDDGVVDGEVVSDSAGEPEAEGA